MASLKALKATKGSFWHGLDRLWFADFVISSLAAVVAGSYDPFLF
jgi:hypothetical protein